MQTSRCFKLCLLHGTLISVALVDAEVRVPSHFGDQMVLQRGRPVPIWGWASAGEQVSLRIAGRITTTRADGDGRWAAELPALPGGGPHRLTVSATNTLIFDDLLMGDVWVCAGQSNMEWGVVVARNHEQEIATANFPRIRLFHVPPRRHPDPARDVEAEWRSCSPRNISYFSAVGYFFGRELHRELDVAIGLVMAAHGGTRIESWTPAVGTAAVRELRDREPHHVEAGNRAAEINNGELYNGMIHPLTPLAVRGVIWYQGEGNVGDGYLYFHRMRALIEGWRQTFQQPCLPFFYVQLAPLNWGGKPVDALPRIWEAQTAVMGIPHTGMVVTNDIGNIGDAHPRNKQDVGKRLARWALAKVYGRRELVCSGPIYDSMQVEGRQIRVRFQHAAGGLIARDDGPLNWFTIAAADRQFVPAEAVIDGTDVLVSSRAVPAPVAVRFAWHQVAEPNLMNRAGLPASAFRTDRWPAADPP